MLLEDPQHIDIQRANDVLQKNKDEVTNYDTLFAMYRDFLKKQKNISFVYDIETLPQIYKEKILHNETILQKLEQDILDFTKNVKQKIHSPDIVLTNLVKHLAHIQQYTTGYVADDLITQLENTTQKIEDINNQIQENKEKIKQKETDIDAYNAK